MSVTQEQLDAAVNAALNGPEARNLRIGHRDWNVKPALITRNGNTLRISGLRGHYISRRRRGPNDRYYYEIVKEGSEIKRIDMERSRGMIRIGRQVGDFAKDLWNAWKDRKGEGDFPHVDFINRFMAESPENRELLTSSKGIAGYVVANIALRAK
jgi:hypothetical protein